MSVTFEPEPSALSLLVLDYRIACFPSPPGDPRRFTSYEQALAALGDHHQHCPAEPACWPEEPYVMARTAGDDEPRLQVAEGNAALLRALGLLPELGVDDILAACGHGAGSECLDGTGVPLTGDIDAQELLERIVLAAALYPDDPGLPRTVCPAGASDTSTTDVTPATRANGSRSWRGWPNTPRAPAAACGGSSSRRSVRPALTRKPPQAGVTPAQDTNRGRVPVRPGGTGLGRYGTRAKRACEAAAEIRPPHRCPPMLSGEVLRSHDELRGRRASGGAQLSATPETIYPGVRCSRASKRFLDRCPDADASVDDSKYRAPSPDELDEFAECR